MRYKKMPLFPDWVIKETYFQTTLKELQIILLLSQYISHDTQYKKILLEGMQFI